jgi:transposase
MSPLSQKCVTLMGMSRQFKTVDYEATLDSSVRLGDCLPPEHLARFVVDIVAQLDLNALYARYGTRGGAPYAPEILLGLLFYGYATGTFSSRKIERATQETAAFRYLAGNLSPDHDTLAAFRKSFLPELKDLFVQILLLAQEMGLLELGNLSLDGSKFHADASKSQAVSYKRLLEIQLFLQAEVEELFALAEAADHSATPEGMNLPQEIANRQERLARLAEAKTVLEARAAERHALEAAEYAAKMRERADKEQRTGKKPPGKPPAPPTPGPKDGDQYNFTDPDSRIMKNSRDDGFSQQYNGQIAVEQDSLLVVGCSLSAHANDQQEVAPTLSSLPAALGPPQAAALDCGYFSPGNVAALEQAGIEAYIATGRDPHNKGWRAFFAEAGQEPAADAPPREKMAYKLRTVLGKALYRRRKCTVEPVFGQIKEVMGFRQFSLRGLLNVTGEWCLVCLAFNLRRLHVLACA